jgi:hypothetical protein
MWFGLFEDDGPRGFPAREHEAADNGSLPDARGEQEEQADLAPEEDRHG